MTSEEIKKIRELAAKSTKVVQWWPYSQYDGYTSPNASVRGPFCRWLIVTGATEGQQGYEHVADLYDDAQFAAAAMNNIVPALDRIARLESALKKAKGAIVFSIDNYNRFAEEGTRNQTALDMLSESLAQIDAVLSEAEVKEGE